jgi:nicotinate-nucleotide adenylyltransferase
MVQLPMKKAQEKINKVFSKTFGKTPLKERLDDIRSEALELSRFQDIKHIKEESGDLLCSLIQLINESGWDAEELVDQTLDKIRQKNIYQSLGRKKNIAIVGLAGNPPTKGHVEMGEYILSEGIVDEVWYMPCYEHMGGKNLVSAHHRLAMLELALSHNPSLKVFDYEIKHKLSGETYFFAKKIEQDPIRENHRFMFVMGQDNANNFDRWYNFEFLEKMLPFIVVNREGYEAKGTWYLKEPHIFLNKKFKEFQISSTLVRELLSKKRNNNDNKSLLKMIDQKVLDYIKKHKLYNVI